MSQLVGEHLLQLFGRIEPLVTLFGHQLGDQRLKPVGYLRVNFSD